jgi:uncharacterized repeat protein (TIGR02543 family)
VLTVGTLWAVLAPGVAPGVAAPAAVAGQGQTCTPTTCTLTDTTVADTTWTVPAGVSLATFTVDGAQGGKFHFTPRGGSGGNGAEVIGTVGALVVGSSYTLSVGGAGSGAGAGGRNGGGSAGGSGGGGGGYSAVLASGGAFELLAGGGGGGGDGYSRQFTGGAGGPGGFNGGAGGAGSGRDAAGGGGGGTQTQGGAGAGGSSDCVGAGQSGASLHGGGVVGDGAGGGGWYGGGSGGEVYYYGCVGSGGGGGGGSSHVDASVTSPSFVSGAWSGDGRIVVSYANPVSAGNAAYTATSGTPLRIGAASGVLAHASGPTTLTASMETPAGHGTVTVNADGSFGYAADTGFIGTDSFTYRATDTSGDYATGAITINVVSPTAETVTFDSQGGGAVTAQTVNSGSTATRPEDPTRAGYTFNGWFTAATGGSRYDFTSPVTSSFTLYAQWNAWTARVSVMPGAVAQGGTFTVHGSGFTPGEKVRAVLHSTSLALGTWTADSTGRLTHTAIVPGGYAIGAHTVVLTGVSDGRAAQAALTVTATPASPAGPGGSPPAGISGNPPASGPAADTGGPLASTGTDTTALLTVVLIALLCGAVLTVAGTRRRYG